MEKGKGNPLAVCPYCGKTLDGYTPVENPGAVPKEDDFSLCIGCYNLVVFNADQTVRKATFMEYMEFDQWMKKTRARHRRKKMN